MIAPVRDKRPSPAPPNPLRVASDVTETARLRRALRELWTETKRTARGVSDALAAGDTGLAAKILTITAGIGRARVKIALRRRWILGKAAAKKGWAIAKAAIRNAWIDVRYAAARLWLWSRFTFAGCLLAAIAWRRARRPDKTTPGNPSDGRRGL